MNVEEGIKTERFVEVHLSQSDLKKHFNDRDIFTDIEIGPHRVELLVNKQEWKPGMYSSYDSYFSGRLRIVGRKPMEYPFTNASCVSFRIVAKDSDIPHVQTIYP